MPCSAWFCSLAIYALNNSVSRPLPGPALPHQRPTVSNLLCPIYTVLLDPFATCGFEHLQPCPVHFLPECDHCARSLPPTVARSLSAAYLPAYLPSSLALACLLAALLWPASFAITYLWPIWITAH
ncbi:hypothetical protein O6H91_Y356000 [Diphasiastrum complanatum]|nr:hypothetical protein O6H91_Y356000 [Diphasiastrum complanatum]